MTCLNELIARQANNKMDAPVTFGRTSLDHSKSEEGFLLDEVHPALLNGSRQPESYSYQPVQHT
jgi:hypothetical protein